MASGNGLPGGLPPAGLAPVVQMCAPFSAEHLACFIAGELVARGLVAERIRPANEGEGPEFNLFTTIEPAQAAALAVEIIATASAKAAVALPAAIRAALQAEGMGIDPRDVAQGSPGMPDPTFNPNLRPD